MNQQRLQTKLLRTIMIDSYFTGKPVEVVMDGFTNLSGTNAAGKTNLLRLLRVFYGESPGDVTKAKGEVHVSFAKYYLARHSSYIIFEYQNATGIKQVVCYSKGDAVNYLFVDKAFDLSDYTEHAVLNETTRPIIPCTNIYRHLQLKGINCKSVESPSAYQKVILGTVNLKDKSLSPIRARYSLAAPGKNLSMLNTVISASVERETDFTKIKEMLSSIMLGGLSNELEFNMDVSKLSSWQTDYRALKAIEPINNKQRPILNNAVARCDLNSKKLSDYKGILLNEIETIKMQYKELSKEYDDAEEELNIRRSEHKTLNESSDDKEAQLNSEVKRLKYEIEAIEAEKVKWEEEPIGLYESELSKEGVYREQLTNRQYELETLMKNMGSIEAEFSKLREKRSLELASNKSSIEKDRDQRKEALSILSAEQGLALQALEHKHEMSLSNVEHEQKSQKLALNQTLQSIEVKLNNIVVPRELHDELESAKALLEQLLQSINEVVEQELELEKARILLRSRKVELAEQAQSTKKEINDCNIKCNELNDILKPKQNSLHDYLVNNVNDWQSNIGRVLPRHILQRTNLNPTYKDGNADSGIYGLTINTDILDDVYGEDQAQILKKINQWELRIRDLEEATDKLKEHSSKTDKEIEQTITKSASLSAKMADLQRRKTTLSNSVNVKKEQINIKEKEMRTALLEEQAALTKECSKLETSHLTQVEKLKEDYFEHLSELQGSQSGARVELEEFIDKCSESLYALKADYDSAMLRLKKDEKARLKNEGVDIDKQDQLKDDISTLEEKLKRLETYPRKLTEYKRFINTTYANLDKLRNKHDALSQELKALQQSIQQADEAWRVYRKTQGEMISALEAKRKDADNKKNRMIAANDNLYDTRPSTNNIANYDVDEILQTLNEVKGAFTKAKREIRIICGQYISQTNSHENSALKKSIVTFMDTYQDDPELIKMANFLISDFQQDISDCRDVVIETASLRGDLLIGFFQQLRQYELDISKFGNRLNSFLEGRTGFTALNTISVELTPLLSSHAMYASLKIFKETHTNWQEHHWGELPDHAYGNAMANVLENFTNNKITERHSNLYKLSFTAEVNQKTHTASNASELKAISSNGMSYLILLSFISSIGCMIKSNQDICLNYPVDELGDISVENISALFDMFANDGDTLTTAIPNADNNYRELYHHRYYLNRKQNRFERIKDDIDELQALLTEHSQSGEQRVI